MTSRTTSPIATIAIDLSQLAAGGAIVVHAPAPALVTRTNPEHVGLTARQLADTLRAMRSHPRFAAEVIAVGKIRGATPTAILGYLRAQSAPTPITTETPAPAAAPKSEERLRRWANGSASR